MDQRTCMYLDEQTDRQIVRFTHREKNSPTDSWGDTSTNCRTKRQTDRNEQTERKANRESQGDKENDRKIVEH